MTLKGPKLDWDFISTWTFRIFMTGMAIGGAYAASVYVTKADAKGMTQPFEQLPGKVERLEEAGKLRDIKWQDFESWRRTKDETDTRLTIIQDNQQRMLERQQQMLDRQQNQIDDLNRTRAK